MTYEIIRLAYGWGMGILLFFFHYNCLFFRSNDFFETR